MRTCQTVQGLQCLPEYYEEFCARDPECTSLCMAFVEQSCRVELAKAKAILNLAPPDVPNDSEEQADPCLQDDADPDHPKPGCENSDAASAPSAEESSPPNDRLSDTGYASNLLPP